MTVVLTAGLITALRQHGVTTHHGPGVSLPLDCVFEPPCSIKWMKIQRSLLLGAFSYAVSGYFQRTEIGRYTSIGEEVQVGRHPHPVHWVSTSPFFYQNYESILDQPLPDAKHLSQADFSRNSAHVVERSTEIGNDVWIGHGAFILPGIRISHGAVVAARSVVTKDVPPYAIVAGAPAQIKRYRFAEREIEKLLKIDWWDYAPWDLRGARVDEIDAFYEFVLDLRQRHVGRYSGKLIKLASLC